VQLDPLVLPVLLDPRALQARKVNRDT
jgi:hypothetical protein